MFFFSNTKCTTIYVHVLVLTFVTFTQQVEQNNADVIIIYFLQTISLECKSVTEFDFGFKLDKHPRLCFEYLDRYAVQAHNLHWLRYSSSLNTSIRVRNYHLNNIHSLTPSVRKGYQCVCIHCFKQLKRLCCKHSIFMQS